MGRHGAPSASLGSGSARAPPEAGQVRATRRSISTERFWTLMTEHIDKLARPHPHPDPRASPPPPHTPYP